MFWFCFHCVHFLFGCFPLTQFSHQDITHHALVLDYCVPHRKGPKKVVRFGIRAPFTTSDNGNGKNCVPYLTELYCTAQWKRGINVLL